MQKEQLLGHEIASDEIGVLSISNR